MRTKGRSQSSNIEDRRKRTPPLPRIGVNAVAKPRRIMRNGSTGTRKHTGWRTGGGF